MPTNVAPFVFLKAFVNFKSAHLEENSQQLRNFRNFQNFSNQTLNFQGFSGPELMDDTSVNP